MADVLAGTCETFCQRVRFFSDWQEVEHAHDWSVYIIASLLELDESEISLARQLKAQHKRYLLFSESLGPESISEYTAELDVRSAERIHTPRLETDTHFTFCRRLVGSLCSSDSDQAILDAWWEADRFALKSATFQRLKVDLRLLPPRVRNASAKHRAKYEIDVDGDFVYWPELDVHMGWSQFRQAVDPAAQLRAQQKSAQFNVAYGRAIRELRDQHKLGQQDIDGVDERTIRRIEHGEQRATVNVIEKLAKAHGMTANEFMNEVAKRL
jgi:hypothetical protein